MWGANLDGDKEKKIEFVLTLILDDSLFFKTCNETRNTQIVYVKPG